MGKLRDLLTPAQWLRWAGDSPGEVAEILNECERQGGGSARYTSAEVAELVDSGDMAAAIEQGLLDDGFGLESERN